MPSIDLSGVAGLQELEVGAEVTLRLYSWGATANGATLAFGRSQQLAGEGGAYQGPALSVGVIPEPSTYALIFGGLALLGVMIRRRLRS